jgi:hypothetical protein
VFLSTARGSMASSPHSANKLRAFVRSFPLHSPVLVFPCLRMQYDVSGRPSNEVGKQSSWLNNSGGTLLHIKAHSSAQSNILFNFRSRTSLIQTHWQFSLIISHCLTHFSFLFITPAASKTASQPQRHHKPPLHQSFEGSNMAVLESHNGYYLWKYLPSVPAAIIFLLLFITLISFHAWKMIKQKPGSAPSS